MLLTGDSLHVRVGLLWSVRVAYDRIARSAPGYLRAVTLGAPQLLLELHKPADVEGLHGYTKPGVLRIGLAVDDRDRFMTELEARLKPALG